MPVLSSMLLVMAAVLGLSGCRQTATAPEQARQRPAGSSPVAATPVSADGRPTVVCFGDSLTAGYGTDPGQSYPDYLGKLLDAQGYAYRVVNAGISGNTTKDGLERLPRLAARKPEVVVLEFGGNDGLRGLPLEQTQANLEAMLMQLQAAGAKVLLAGITLPPDYGPDYIRRFTAMYTSLAKKHKVPLLPFLLQGVYGTPGGMQADATHATAQGNQQVARNVATLLEPLLVR